jgi:serine/threonine protein kinase
MRSGPYTAPERSGDTVAAASEAADVYCVGACLYFCVAKRAPERSESGRVRPLREIAPATSEPLASVIDHALMADPLQRYESAYAMLGDVRRVMVGRKPKLADAMSPVPSQSLGEIPQMTPPSSRRVPSASQAQMPKSGPLSITSQRLQRKRETRGNFMLVLAIALLVGTATFVLVREKMNDARDEQQQQQQEPVKAGRSPN